MGAVTKPTMLSALTEGIHFFIDEGRIRPVVRGGDDPDPNPNPPPVVPVTGVGTFTAEQLAALQAQLDAAVTRGRQEAEAELIGRLGFSDRATLEGAVYAAHQRTQAEMSDAERARQQAEQAITQSTTVVAEAQALSHQARVLMAIVDAGVPGRPADAPADQPGPRDLVATLVQAHVQPGADEAAIAAAVERVRAAAPALFDGAAPAASAPRPFGGAPLPTPAPRPAGNQADRSAAVKERLERIRQDTGIGNRLTAPAAS